MASCEYTKLCPFHQKTAADLPDDVDDQIDHFCRENSLHCARSMVYDAKGTESVPEDLFPKDKTRAYGLIAD